MIPKTPILDACCGSRMFWFDKDNPNVTFMDIRDEECVLSDGQVVIDDFCPPCGVCRQVLSEFCTRDFKVILANGKGEEKIFTLAELLPESFSLK